MLIALAHYEPNTALTLKVMLEALTDVQVQIAASAKTVNWEAIAISADVIVVANDPLLDDAVFALEERQKEGIKRTIIVLCVEGNDRAVPKRVRELGGIVVDNLNTSGLLDLVQSLRVVA